jgi:CTP synthase
VHDVSNIYHVPLVLEEQGLHRILAETLGLSLSSPLDLDSWRAMAKTVDSATEPVVIAVVGKYTDLHDAYLSVIKALKHASIAEKKDLILTWIESSDLEEGGADEDKHREAWAGLRDADGVLIPGGFGDRGLAGKIAAAKYAREARVPILGVCLGLQVMVIEHARNVLGWKDANSTEMSEQCSKPVVIKMLEHHTGVMGGTMRLGARDTILHALPSEDKQERSIAACVYSDAAKVSERHRHRYEVNPDMLADLQKAGLRFTGKDETNQRMEMVELPRSQHPFYFGVQFHPELKSRPERPSPPFHALVLAAIGRFSQHYGVPESAAITSTSLEQRMLLRKRRPSHGQTPRGTEFSGNSAAPGVGAIKRPRIFSDSNSNSAMADEVDGH